MEYYSIAKSLHILGVVLWIGGVTFVTFVLIPSVRKIKNIENQFEIFEKIEHRFSKQAMVWNLLTGATGFYLVHVLDAWGRFLYLEYWWMHAMLAVWFIFFFILFILEPIILHKYFKKQSSLNPQLLMKRVYYLHIVLVILSLITVVGAMLGTH